MTDSSVPMFFFCGAGAEPPDLDIFSSESSRIEVIRYPGWKRYIDEGFSPEVFIEELATEIQGKIPCGPLGIIGSSIGAHFGYASALRLQASGRQIAGFCAIDSFMAVSSEPSRGWKSRAFAEAWNLLTSFKAREFARFLRSKSWRALCRLSGDRLPWILQCFANRLPGAISYDRILEQELSMRLLIRQTATSIASLDLDPVPLQTPAALLRTAHVATDDAAWRRRCPKIKIFEIPGEHRTIYESQNI